MENIGNKGSSFSDCARTSISFDEGYLPLEEGSYADTDSDDEYDSIQRPAFQVDGEPNFDSGPPEDGLEYLRRVRYYI